MLLGRALERARLAELIAAATTGSGGALVVEGSPGVGKTALLEEASRCSDGLSVRRLGGVESELSLSYAALHQLCGPLMKRIDHLPTPQANALARAFGELGGPAPDRFLVSLGALGLLSDLAAEQPVLCLIDDAHWLDPESLQALGFVARRSDADSLAIVFATRFGLDSLAGLPRLVLGGLSEHDARDLLASVVPGRIDSRIRDRIIVETQGNPLALLELPHGLRVDQLAGGFGLPNAERVSNTIEDEFVRRSRELPADTQQVLLLMASDPIGETSVIRLAAQRLGIALEDALGPAENEGLVAVNERISFRHPLVRSAVYRVASSSEQRGAHSVLAAALDSSEDRDRRAWHLAHASIAPNDQVAGALEQSAGRAHQRGGPAGAAAFLKLAASFASKGVDRVRLTIASAQASYEAGALRTASTLLDRIETASIGEAALAQIDLIRAQIAFTESGSGQTVVLLTSAARRLESTDTDAARSTFVSAFSAGSFLGRDVTIDQWLELGTAASKAPRPLGRPTARDLLLDGLAAQLTTGFEASLTPLQAALSEITSQRDLTTSLDVLWLACCVAISVWDDETWHELSERFVETARRSGALVHLLNAVQMRAIERVLAGDLAAATSLVDEKNLLTSIIGATHGGESASAFVTAWSGVAEPAPPHLPDAAITLPWGFEADVSCYATSIQCNSLGNYRSALEAAVTFVADANGRWAPALPELVEAAVRCDQMDTARLALEHLTMTTSVSGTNWALGVESMCRALVSDEASAEAFYLESTGRLRQTRVVTALARAELLYGEWLRRQHRQLDARSHLRAASELFDAMGATAFAARAGRELLATGERARRRTDATRTQLTPQEQRIANLASMGRSNVDIGSAMFLSPRTIEYHLHKVFAKLGISSRTQLASVLKDESGL